LWMDNIGWRARTLLLRKEKTLNFLLLDISEKMKIEVAPFV
jgi:hypothetical protein